MKRSISIGFTIVGIAIFLVFASVSIIHYFKFAGEYNVAAWFACITGVQQKLALIPEVFGALGFFIIGTILLRRKPRTEVTKGVAINFGEIITAMLIATAAWVALAFITKYIFKGPDSPAVQKLVEWYVAIFYRVMSLGPGNYLLAGVYVFIAANFGRAVIGQICRKIEFSSRLQEFIFSAAVGLGLLGLVVYLIGLAHILYPIVVYIVYMAAFLFALTKAEPFIPDMASTLLEIKFRGITLWLFIILLFIILCGAYTPLFPPFFYDAMNSHLEAPKVFIHEHGISFHPYINFNNFPMNVEMLYILPMMLGRVVVANVLTFLFFLMSLGAVYEFCREHFKSSAAGLCAAIFLCLTPKSVQLFSGATVDIPLMFFIMVAGLAIARWLYSKRDEYAILAGLILGFALGTKYTAVAFFLIYILWVLIQKLVIDNSGARRMFGRLLMMVAIAIVICSPYYIRNIALFGNPFFPFYENTFSWIPVDGSLAELKPQLMVNEAEMFDMFTTQGSASQGISFLPSISFAGKDDLGNTIGPMYIAILPFLLFMGLAWIGKAVAKYAFKWQVDIGLNFPLWMCIAVIIAYSAYWAFGAKMIHARYFYPATPFMAIAAAYVCLRIFRLEKISADSLPALLIVIGIGALCLVYFNQGLMVSHISELPITQSSEERFLKEKLTSYEMVQYINNDLKLGPSDIVYGVGSEDTRYYANFTLIGGQWGYADWRGFSDATSTGESLREYLLEYGASYLIFDTNKSSYLNKTYGKISLPNDPEFKQYFEEVRKDERVTLYKIN